MRRSGCLLLLLLACSAVAANAKLGDRVTKLRESEKITAESVLKGVSELINAAIAEAKAAAEQLAAKRPDGLLAKRLDERATARSLLSVGQDIHSFFSNMLGSKWADIVPASWSAPSFDWAKLGEFEYNSNLAEFLDAADLQSLGEIGSLKDLNESVAAIEAAFCEPESHEKGEKKAAECTGPTVSIELAPKVCILDAKAKEVVCDPAKLILKKTPGSCTHKYTSAFVWTGKECKLSGGAGFAEEKVVGGGNKIIPLKDLTIEYEP